MIWAKNRKLANQDFSHQLPQRNDEWVWAIWKSGASNNNQKSPDETCRSCLITFSVLECTCDWWLFHLSMIRLSLGFPLSLCVQDIRLEVNKWSENQIITTCTARKSNTDTQTSPIWKEIPFANHHFVYPCANIPGCKSFILEKKILETFLLIALIRSTSQKPESR